MHTEKDFEDHIEQCLIDSGYLKGNAKDYDKALALFPADVFGFIQDTQPKLWQRMAELYGSQAEQTLQQSLCRELQDKGALAVLRGGFKCAGKTFRLAYFAPNSALNPESQALFAQNRVRVFRQVETQSGAVPDLVLAVNGLPVATMELKNPFTGQTVLDAKRQYCGRDVSEPLFAFKSRALVHFAVDTESVWMTTRLEGENTFFLPFNLGYQHGAGNPPSENGVRTEYLWQRVLNKADLMDILARFVHLQVKETQIQTDRGLKIHRKETLIFPRFHQWDVVKKLTAHAKAHGSGHNYLIQHSAGSGKSNSIAWLAHRLANLHNEQNEKIFHSVIVLTDRVVLDKQLQDTIFQFEHKLGVVEKIDQDTQQLAKALSNGVPIIISTIQKFPFISQALETLQNNGAQVAIETKNRRFAVIVDEAHSSQSGETAMELRKILNKDGIEAAIAEQILDMDDEPLSDEAKAELLRNQLKRGRQPNLSFFAFTATPKFKTLCLFDEAGDDGKAPFHLYSMKQAIEEGFILDVLAHYTTYKRYYKLTQLAADDPELPRKKAAKALARFVAMHDYEIAQKAEVIVEHFRTHTKHKIGGRAKAMVVTSSREHAVRYKLGLDKYIKDKGYTDVKSLVAFSGEISLKEYPTPFTEVGMNGGIRESELPEKFAGDEYRVLLVAEKYQTGFDQPLLHTMYVDKKLSGVQAVQTLSRLNRTARGKSDTFVLDFANTQEEIFEAFKDYYEITEKADDVDTERLNGLANEILNSRLFTQEEVDGWCDIWFAACENLNSKAHGRLNALIDVAVERFKALPEEEQEQRKSQLQGFRKLYAFISQIIPYQDSQWEKLYSYIRFLLPKLPFESDDRLVSLDNEVELQYYRLQKISEGAIRLSNGQAEGLTAPNAVGTRQKEEDAPLSEMIEKLNDRFGTDFTQADRLFFEQIAEAALANEQLQQAGKANSKQNFMPVFKQLLEGLFVERMEDNQDIFTNLMNDRVLYNAVAEHLAERVYPRLSARE